MNRRFAAAVLVVFYTAIALAGPELHALLDCDHDESSQQPTRSVGREQVNSSTGRECKSAGHDEETCPVCKLLSMPRASFAAAAEGSFATDTSERIVIFCAPAVAALHAPFLIRGPPARSHTAAISCA